MAVLSAAKAVICSEQVGRPAGGDRERERVVSR